MNDLLNFAHSTARWWQRPRVQRAARALLILWLVNALIGTITEKWWCESLGVGALWTQRTFAQAQLFCTAALLGSALLNALICFLTPRAEPVFGFNRRSVLQRLIAIYARDSRRLGWRIGALGVLWQSRRAASWGDEWLLWRNGQSWGERDWSGEDWSAWLWSWPLFDGLNRVVWSSVSWALLVGLVLHGGQIAFVALHHRDENELWRARRFLWLLGALWFGCLGARYLWLRANNAVAWRGDEALVPVGWDWLSWHWTRVTDGGGVALALCGMVLCARAALRAASTCSARLHSTQKVAAAKVAAAKVAAAKVNDSVHSEAAPRIYARETLGASTCSAHLRPIWRVALLAWWLPGTLQVLAGGPLWRLVVAPDQNAREAPFIARYRQSTQRAWRIVTETRVVHALPVETLTATERATLANTARVWDEEALQAALGTRNGNVMPTLNRENQRLVAVTTRGVYDAARAMSGQPPLLRAFATPIIWPPAPTSEERGDIVLTPLNRIFWAWRLRDVGALWRKYATLHPDWNERARAMLPGARIVDAPYLTPDGWLVQNLSGTTPQLPGVGRIYDAQGEIAQISDAARITVSPSGKTRLWAGSSADIWTRSWRELTAALGDSSVAPSGVRASKSGAQMRVQIWNRLVRAHEPDWSSGELEYALLPAPAGHSAHWVLQGLIREKTRLAGWLEIAADESQDPWRMWKIAPSLGQMAPSWPLNEEAARDESVMAGRGAEVKTARVRSKVLVAPLWRGAVSGTSDEKAALLLWQNQYAAPAAAWLPVRVMPQQGWNLDRMALSDATREERVVVGRSVDELLAAWSRRAPVVTSAQTAQLVARRAAQELGRLLEAEENALRSGDWARADALREQERAILDTLK